MALIVIITGIVALAALVAKYWSWIRDTLFQKFIRPLVRRILGGKAENRLVDFMVWLDNGICLERRAAKLLWNYFRMTVLKLETRYQSIDGQVADKVTTIELLSEDGSVEIRQHSETVPHEEIPSQARKEMLRAGTKSAVMDDRAIVEEKFNLRWQESGGEPLTLEA